MSSEKGTNVFHYTEGFINIIVYVSCTLSILFLVLEQNGFALIERPRLLVQWCLSTRLTLKSPPEIAMIPTIVEARFGREDSLVFALSETILADERIPCSCYTLSFSSSDFTGTNGIL